MIRTQLWELAGWTMLHVVWVGGLIALIAAAGRWLLRHGPVSYRHLHALGSLLTLGVSPFVIAWSLWPQIPEPAAVQPAATIVKTTLDVPQAASVGQEFSKATEPRFRPETTRIPGEPAPQTSRLSAIVGWLPWVWLSGTPLTFAFLAMGMLGAERLRKEATILRDDPIAERCRQLAASLGIARKVAVGLCDQIAGPVLIGIVRPLILLPPSALSGWTPEEVEFVLLHELLHVRRGDNLVQLVQSLIESFLFFHPATWLISGWVRQDRELCCDLAVVERTGEPFDYARTLLSISGLHLATDRVGLAMARNHLVTRIDHILNRKEATMLHNKFSRPVIATACALLLAPALLALAQSPTKPAPKLRPAAEMAAELQKIERFHATLPAASNNDVEVQRLISLAKAQARLGRPERARESLEQAARAAQAAKTVVIRSETSPIKDGGGSLTAKSVAYGPSSTELLREVALEQAKVGDRVGALASLNRAIVTKAPDTPESFRLRTLVKIVGDYRRLGELERVRATLALIDRMQAEDGISQSPLELASPVLARFEAGETAQAFADLDAFQKQPQWREIYISSALMEACISATIGDFPADDVFINGCISRLDRIKAPWSRAMVIQPLTTLLARKGDDRRARELVETIQSNRTAGFDPAILAKIPSLFEIAQEQLRLGKIAEAKATYERAIDVEAQISPKGILTELPIIDVEKFTDPKDVRTLITRIPAGQRWRTLAELAQHFGRTGNLAGTRSATAEGLADIEALRGLRLETEQERKRRGMPEMSDAEWNNELSHKQIQVLIAGGDLGEARRIADTISGSDAMSKSLRNTAAGDVAAAMTRAGDPAGAMAWLHSLILPEVPDSNEPLERVARALGEGFGEK